MVSRFMRSAIRRTPACTGSARPARISSIAARASSRVRSLLYSGPVATFWMQARRMRSAAASDLPVGAVAIFARTLSGTQFPAGGL